MKFLLVLSCLLGVCLGASLDKKLQPCETPSLTGQFELFMPNDGVLSFGNYVYDASLQRMRVFQIGEFGNDTFIYDNLLLIQEGVQYLIDYGTQTCTKSPLNKDFPPLGVPPDATFLNSAVIGSSSEPRQGLSVNTWTKTLRIGGEYQVTVTEFGCVPVYSSFRLTDGKGRGQFVMSYINAVKGVLNPERLKLPSFCTDEEKKPVDFFTVLKNMLKKPNEN